MENIDNTKNSLNDNFVDSLAALDSRITDFQKNKLQKKQQTAFKKSTNIAIVYNVFADLLAGVITAFILNKIYTSFFEKNTLVFALLLIFCLIGGLYLNIKFFLQNNS